VLYGNSLGCCSGTWYSSRARIRSRPMYLALDGFKPGGVFSDAFMTAPRKTGWGYLVLYFESERDGPDGSVAVEDFEGEPGGRAIRRRRRL
jgi:hypothetical protein